MIFQLLPDLRDGILFWRFHPADSAAEALLKRFGFHPGDVEASGQTAIATARMLRGAGALLTDKSPPAELTAAAT